MSGSDATSSARNPSGTYICANVCSPGVRGGEGIGLGFKCWRTGLVLSRSTSGSGFSAMAALVSKQSEHAIPATRSSRRRVKVELTRTHFSKQQFKGQNNSYRHPCFTTTEGNEGNKGLRAKLLRPTSTGVGWSDPIIRSESPYGENRIS